MRSDIDMYMTIVYSCQALEIPGPQYLRSLDLKNDTSFGT